MMIERNRALRSGQGQTTELGVFAGPAACRNHSGATEVPRTTLEFGALVGLLNRLARDQIPEALVFLVGRLVQETAQQRAKDGNGDADLEALLTAEQLALYLNVPESWVRTEQRAGRIPAVRLGKKYVRFRRSDVEAALAESRRRKA